MIPALVVPVLNRPDLLQRMLLSIDYPVDDLLVIDNGRVVDALPPLPTVRNPYLLRMPGNLGVAGSWNLAIRTMPFAPYWMIVNSDAWFPPGSLAALAAVARRDGIVLSGAEPPYAAFCLGDGVVAACGLFDESLHPAYMEDLDMERRAVHAGLTVVRTSVPVHHDNSSTIAERRYADLNSGTYSANSDYYRGKIERGDVSEGRWDLWRRRELSWD